MSLMCLCWILCKMAPKPEFYADWFGGLVCVPTRLAYFLKSWKQVDSFTKMGPSPPNCQKIQLRTSNFDLHLGRTEGQLDVQGNRPDSAEGPLYVQGSRHFLAQILASTEPLPKRQIYHEAGITYPTLQMTRTSLNRRVFDD